MKDRGFATRAAHAVGAMRRWLPHARTRWPCFSCRATGHNHGRDAEGCLAWHVCEGCEGQSWFRRQQPGGAELTDRELVALYESELQRRRGSSRAIWSARAG
jgi:hypothetical protein